MLHPEAMILIVVIINIIVCSVVFMLAQRIYEMVKCVVMGTNERKDLLKSLASVSKQKLTAVVISSVLFAFMYNTTAVLICLFIFIIHIAATEYEHMSTKEKQDFLKFLTSVSNDNTHVPHKPQDTVKKNTNSTRSSSEDVENTTKLRDSVQITELREKITELCDEYEIAYDDNEYVHCTHARHTVPRPNMCHYLRSYANYLTKDIGRMGHVRLQGVYDKLKKAKQAVEDNTLLTFSLCFD